MEITSNLQRIESSQWVQKASAFAGQNMAGGDITADADFNCNHAGVMTYRTVAFGWSVINGSGWGAANTSSSAVKTCPDSF